MFLNRQQLEAIEDSNLAPYACRSKNSRGRYYPEDEPEYRTVFQRDRDRVLHTTAFKRLKYKSQVFFNNEGDYFRTRLTHTLEVVQIGRTIARALGANEDLVECICLAHDLGQPAFGDSGEAALARLMMDYGGFDHNRQSLRTVTLLERRYPEFPGLNLTYEVREGVVKHEAEFEVNEAADYEPALRAHLEAQISNIADALAGTALDIDEGLRSGMVSPNQFSGITIWEILLESLKIKEVNFDELARHRVVRRLIGMEVTDLIQTTHLRLQDSKIHSLDELQKLPYNVISFSEDTHRRNRQLNDFLHQNLYRHNRVIRMSMKAERIITDLFNAMCQEPQLLPESYLDLIESNGLERTICDYLAGMTDHFAIEEHQKIFDPTWKT